MSGVRTICICTETEREHRPFYACPAHNAAKGRPATTPADVTREPTGGQGLREAIKDTLRLYGIRGEQLGSLRPGSVADAVLALPELAALIADAERVRRVRALLDDHGSVIYPTTLRIALEGSAEAALRAALDGEPQP